MNLTFRFGKLVLTLALLFVPIVGIAQDPAKNLTPRAIAAAALPSTVLLVLRNRITDTSKTGSGFFVGKDVIATNFHVIEDSHEGYVKIYGSKTTHEITGIIAYEINDLALLKVKGLRGKPLSLSRGNSVAIGDEIYAVSSPEGLEGTFSQGLVSGIRTTDSRTLLQITASISAGSSGGAVLNKRGEVIGVAVGGLVSGQSLNFAVPISLLHSLIARPTQLLTLKEAAGNNIEVGTIRKNRFGMELVYIPPGSFTMGSREIGEEPERRVSISDGFWIGKYEVTQGQWDLVVGSRWTERRSEAIKKLMLFRSDHPNFPEFPISWGDAEAFVLKLNAADDGLNYRIPTEEEWEYAARGGISEPYYGPLDEIAWYGDNSLLRMPEAIGQVVRGVGKKKPNSFGLHDVIGNVSEWTAGSGSNKVWKGCSYIDGPFVCRVSFRGFGGDRTHEVHLLGLRIVASVR